jgi:hypothetical protein
VSESGIPEGVRRQRFCGNCGSEVRPGNVFCVYCGERLERQEGNVEDHVERVEKSRKNPSSLDGWDRTFPGDVWHQDQENPRNPGTPASSPGYGSSYGGKDFGIGCLVWIGIIGFALLVTLVLAGGDFVTFYMALPLVLGVLWFVSVIWGTWWVYDVAKREHPRGRRR